MIYFVWLLSIVIAFETGYFFRRVTQHIDMLEEVVKTKIDKKPVEEPQSSLIDLTDPIKEAQYAREQLMKEMNPDE